MEVDELEKLVDRAPRLLRAIEIGITQILVDKDETKIVDVVRDIDEFQEDPRLLDGLSVATLPLIGEAYLTSLDQDVGLGENTIAAGFGKLVYTMAKVRGEKAIAMRLPSQPYNFIPVLNSLERLSLSSSSDSSLAQGTWEERYSLLLWLSNLISLPFNLAGLSDEVMSVSEEEKPTAPLPEVSQRVVDLAKMSLNSPSREGSPAATVLARHCLRPDMASYKLPERLLKDWALPALRTVGTSTIATNIIDGPLLFLKKLLKSADTRLISSWILPLSECYEELSSSSAIQSVSSRSLIMKGRRSVVARIFTKKSPNQAEWEHAMQIVEDNFENLGSNEYRIRQVAAKCLASAVRSSNSQGFTIYVLDELCQKLENELDHDFTEEMYLAAVLVDQTPIHPSTYLTWASPNLWQGVLFVFCFMFADGAFVTKGRIMKSLQRCFRLTRIGLNFENSSDISKLGKCELVRDAANNAVYILAYALSRVLQNNELWRFTIALIDSFCFESSNKVRLASVGAIQQLLGGKSGIVENGISILQAAGQVSSHSHPGAMSDAPYHLASISPLYRVVAIKGLMGWRGALSGQVGVRMKATETFKELAVFASFHYPEIFYPPDLLTTNGKPIDWYFSQQASLEFGYPELIQLLFKRLNEAHDKHTEVGGEDGRHGYLLQLSAVLHSIKKLKLSWIQSCQSQLQEVLQLLADSAGSVVIFEDPLYYSSLNASAKYNCRAILFFISGFANAASWMEQNGLCSGSHQLVVSKRLLDCFQLCIRRPEMEMCEDVPAAVQSLAKVRWEGGNLDWSGFEILNNDHKAELHSLSPNISSQSGAFARLSQIWLVEIGMNDGSKMISSSKFTPGLYVALGTAAGHLSVVGRKDWENDSLWDYLRPIIRLFIDKTSVDRRMTSLKALKAFIQALHNQNPKWYEQTPLFWGIDEQNDLIITSDLFNHAKDYFGDLSNSSLDTSQRDQLTDQSRVIYREIMSTICVGLEDFTLTERGDVGSTVRLEALSLLCTLWETGPRNFQMRFDKPSNLRLHAAISCSLFRLSFDILDKIRETVNNLLFFNEDTTTSFGTCFYLGRERPASLLATGAYPKPEICFAYLLQHLKEPSYAYAHRAIVDGFCELVAFGSTSVSAQVRGGFESIIRSSRNDLEVFVHIILKLLCSGLDRKRFDWHKMSPVSSRLDFDRLAASKLETLTYLGLSGILQDVQETTWFKALVIIILLPSISNLLTAREKTSTRTRHACYGVLRLIGINSSTKNETDAFLKKERNRLENRRNVSFKQKSLVSDAIWMLDQTF